MATKTYEQSVDEYQKKMNRWNEVRRILGPAMYHTISTACALAAKQYREDMVVAHMPETDRVSDQFHRQAKECEEMDAHGQYASLGTNGGQECDVRSGPCSCGAWH